MKLGFFLGLVVGVLLSQNNYGQDRASSRKVIFRLGDAFEQSAQAKLEKVFDDYEKAELNTLKEIYSSESSSGGSSKWLKAAASVYQQLEKSISLKFAAYNADRLPAFPSAKELLDLDQKDHQAADTFVKSLSKDEARFMLNSYFMELRSGIARTLIPTAVMSLIPFVALAHLIVVQSQPALQQIIGTGLFIASPAVPLLTFHYFPNPRFTLLKRRIGKITQTCFDSLLKLQFPTR